MKWTIVIPYFNLKAYTDELLDCLKPQMTDGVEVLIIDDGSETPYETSYDWVKVIRKENGGVSTARNLGIEKSQGEYISFIDADDLVADTYVEQILGKIEEGFDYLEMSWNSLPGGQQWSQKLNSIEDSLPNPSVCTRVFKKSVIGNLRFNEKKYSTEDDEFKRKLYYNLRDKKKAVITDYLYHYRTSVENSKSKRFMNGELPTKRIVYYYDHITKDMDYLVDEIAAEDEYNEVWVLTNQNDLPELAYYAHVKKPFNVRGMELRGQPFKGFSLIKQAYRTQVVLYIEKSTEITGITTWIYNFCLNMNKRKDIIVLYKEMDSKQLMRLIPLVQCEKVGDRKIICDTLIMCSIKDQIPKNVQYKKSVQVIHSCKDSIPLPKDRDVLVSVSQTSKNSFGCDSIVIPNLMGVCETRYLLVSTVRIGAADKGENNERMLKLAKILNDNKIKFTWLYFSSVSLQGAPGNMIQMKPTLDVLDWIRRADFLVNLSDQEGFCYSIVEAMWLGTQVITTDINVLSEIGFKDHFHGFRLPFDFSIDDALKPFKYPYVTRPCAPYDNASIINKWMNVLGNKQPKGNYHFDADNVTVQVRMSYKDMQLGREVFRNETFRVSHERALHLRSLELVDILY